MDDVFGILSPNDGSEDKPVILKSKARKICMGRDGMDEEEFNEYWDYNIAGAKGESAYSTVDDTLELEIIAEIFKEEEEN